MVVLGYLTLAVVVCFIALLCFILVLLLREDLRTAQKMLRAQRDRKAAQEEEDIRLAQIEILREMYNTK